MTVATLTIWNVKQKCILDGSLFSLFRASTFFSSFSDADGDTPRMSYSLVSTTFDMVLLWMLLQHGGGWTKRKSRWKMFCSNRVSGSGKQMLRLSAAASRPQVWGITGNRSYQHARYNLCNSRMTNIKCSMSISIIMYNLPINTCTTFFIYRRCLKQIKTSVAKH